MIKVKILNLSDTYIKEELQKFLQYYKFWLDNKYNADMMFLEKHYELKKDYNNILPNAQSLIIFIIPYTVLKLANISPFIINKIAKYAWFENYHKQIPLLLQKILNNIPETKRIIVDTAPFPEKFYAKIAGLGDIAYNSLFITKDFGSRCFIANILSVLNTEPLYKILSNYNFLQLNNEPFDINNYCLNCQKCINACPTNAILANKMIDTNKCLSYLSIEKKGIINTKYLKLFKNYIFGCDICQNICPLNNKADNLIIDYNNSVNNKFNYNLLNMQNMTYKKYIHWFNNTSLIRTGYYNLIRNVNYSLLT